MDIGDYPNDLLTFKKYLKDLRSLFQIDDRFVKEAQDRYSIFLINFKFVKFEKDRERGRQIET